MGYKFFTGICLFIVTHILVWFSTNLQLVERFNSLNTLALTIALAIPTSLCGYYGTRLIYDSLQDSLWAVRFVGFGQVFPPKTHTHTHTLSSSFLVFYLTMSSIRSCDFSGIS